MLRAFRVLLMIAIVLGLGAGVLMVFAPVDHYRTAIEAAVKDATGRELHIEGPVHLIFTPGPALDLGPVRMAGADGSNDTVRAANAVIEVELLPLLGSRIRISRLTLTGADLYLDHRASFAPVDGKPQAAPVPLRLRTVRLVTSRIHMKDEARDISFGALDLRLSWPRDGASLSVQGLIDLGGETFDVDASTDRPGALLGGEGRLPLKVAFDGALAKGSLDGAIDLGGFAFEGLLNVTTPSARRILALYGVTIPGDRGLHSLSMAATLRAQPGQARLRNAKFALDSTTGSGAFGLKLDQGRLMIAGTLSVDQVDTSTYLAVEEPMGAEDDGHWSEAAVDLSGLHTMDIDLQINARRATVADLDLRDVDAEFVAEGGRGALTITRATAYAGALSGRLTVDVTGDVPEVGADFTVSGFDAQGLFAAAFGSGTLAGRGDMTIALKGRGASQATLVQALEGDVALKLIDGALDGVDLPAVARTVTQEGAVSGTGPEAATDLKSLAATFHVVGGVAYTDEVTLIGPFLQLSARGAIGLPARALRMRVAPRFVNDIYGQPGADEAGTFAMPFAALGPWDAPAFVPDWRALADMVAEGKVDAAELAKLPEPAHSWFTSAKRATLPELPAVPGVPDPPPS